MTKTYKYCSFCKAQYLSTHFNKMKEGLVISSKGKILVHGYNGDCTLPTGEYYDKTKWRKWFDRKPTTIPFTGCKMSHGRCNTCADTDKNIPFFATNLDTWNANPKKAWTKQKGMKKQLRRWLVNEIELLK